MKPVPVCRDPRQLVRSVLAGAGVLLVVAVTAALKAFARVYVGAHFPVDVLAGLAVAVLEYLAGSHYQRIEHYANDVDLGLLRAAASPTTCPSTTMSSSTSTPGQLLRTSRPDLAVARRVTGAPALIGRRASRAAPGRAR